MAVGGVLVPALQYGLPAAFQLIDLGLKWSRYFSSDEARALTQAEFAAKWDEMRAEYAQATDAHEALRLQGK